MADVERHYVFASVPGSAWSSFGRTHATVPNALATNLGPIDIFKRGRNRLASTHVSGHIPGNRVFVETHSYD
jgi:hypothetical protein